jgi:hypothetical protein
MIKQYSGIKNYNPIFNLIELAVNNRHKIYAFHTKFTPLRNYGAIEKIKQNTDGHLLTGNQAGHYLDIRINKINIEIPFDINQSSVLSENFDITKTEINEYLNIPDIYEDNNLVIQVATRKAQFFEIRNFRIIETINGKKLVLDSQGTITEETYKENYNFGTEYGHVTLNVNLNLPNFYIYDNFKFKLKSTDNLIIDEKTYRESMINNPNDIRIQFLVASKIINLYIIFKLLDFKGINDMPNNLEDYLNFYIMSLTNNNSMDLFCMSEIDFESFPDLNKEIYKAYTSPDNNDTVLYNQADALNKFSYNVLFTLGKEGYRIINGFETLDFGRTKEESDLHIDIARQARFKTTDISLIFPKKTELEEEEISALHKDLYDNIMNDLKEKWEKTFKVYKRLFNPKPVDENFFAVLFMQKYFIPSVGIGRQLSDLSDSSLIPIISFFEKVIGNFEDFFGDNKLSKYTETIASLNVVPYSWARRLERDYYNLNSIKSPGYYNINIISNFFPAQSFFEVNHRGSNRDRWASRKNLVIVNDSGTKVAWKKKTRVFLENLTSNNNNIGHISIIDPTDKFQLLLIKRLANESSIFLLYSDFANDVQLSGDKKEKKAISTETIKYYTAASFGSPSRHNGTVINIDNIDLSDKIFLEFSTTKKMIYTQWGNMPIDSSYQKKFWQTIFKKYNNKSIYLVSKNHLKKLREAYPDEVITLEEFIQTDEFREGVSEIHSSYLFVPTKRSINQDILPFVRNFTRFIIKEFIKPIFEFRVRDSHPFNNGRYILSDIFEMVIRSLPDEIKQSINYLMSLRDPNTQYINNSIYNLEHAILSRIIQEPTITGTLDYEIFRRIPDNDERELIYSTLSALGEGIIHRSNLYLGDTFFMMKSFIEDVSNLLVDSNMLNLPIEERNIQINTLMYSWLQRWNNKIDFIKLVYEQYKPKED